MPKNMIAAVRLIRIAAAGVMIGLVLTGTVSGVMGLILTIFAIVFIATGSFGYCPAYSLFRKKREGHE